MAVSAEPSIAEMTSEGDWLMAAIGEDEGDGDEDDDGGELQLSGIDPNSRDRSTYVQKVIMVSSNLRFLPLELVWVLAAARYNNSHSLTRSLTLTLGHLTLPAPALAPAGTLTLTHTLSLTPTSLPPPPSPQTRDRGGFCALSLAHPVVMPLPQRGFSGLYIISSYFTFANGFKCHFCGSHACRHPHNHGHTINAHVHDPLGSSTMCPATFTMTSTRLYRPSW